MNYLREKVSGNKNRMKEQNYNLDLTYICPRILAMSFPGEGLEKAYRNDINEVACFMKEKHKNDFQIYNLSGRNYDYTKFMNKVYDFPWEDHHSPPLSLLFMLCKHIDDFLSSKLSNVVVIHCLAGKGRTGTAICCYMMYSGRFSEADEALNYYAKQRFSKGGGVTQPSQIRYVNYFASILHNPTHFPVMKYISSVTIDRIPDFQEQTCRPFMEIYTFKNNTMQLQYSDKEQKYKDQRKYRDMKIKELNSIKLNVSMPFAAIGDILIKIYHNGQFKVEPICRIAFNTAFIEDNQMIFPKNLIDPHKIMSDNKIPAETTVEINFSDYCKCTNLTDFKDRCKNCLQISQQDKADWNIIQNIMNDYSKHTLEESQILLFGDIQFDNLNEVKYQICIYVKNKKDQGIKLNQQPDSDDEDS